jgi:putative N6-adenine-specific DNA methylase
VSGRSAGRQRDRFTDPNAGLLPLFAACSPGLERFVADELRALGCPAVKPLAGGVSFQGRFEPTAQPARHDALRVAERLRTASRVLLRLGTFRAAALSELRRKADALPFAAFLRPDTTLDVRVSTSRSRLVHTGAIAERLVEAARAQGISGQDSDGRSSTDGRSRDGSSHAGDNPQRLVVRVHRDVFTVSLDAAGALLHERGWRQDVGRASLRETLACAALAHVGWHGQTPLLDPCCGSGTIALEAAGIAHGLLPGRARGFACERWLGASARDRGSQPRATPQTPHTPQTPLILGSDRDERVLGAARDNAARAGLGDRVTFEHATVSDAAPAGGPLDGTGPGLLLTNPPWGRRLGERRTLPRLYAAIGQLARERLPGFVVAIIGPDEALARATGLRFGHISEPWRDGNVRLRVFATGRCAPDA